MLALALTALGALAAAVAGQCPEISIYEPLNKTMRRLAVEGTFSWHDVDTACNDQFTGGFEMLARDFMLLSDEDRALCRGQLVPLGLQKDGLGPIVWRWTEYLRETEEVNSTYTAVRARYDAVRGFASRARVGALDTATNRWRLVDNATTFSCAICQRTWIDSLGRLSTDTPQRPEPFRRAYAFRLVKTGHDNVTVDEAVRQMVDILNQTVNPWTKKGMVTAVETLAVDPGDHGATTLRLHASRSLDVGKVAPTLNGSFGIDSWMDMNWCPETRRDGIDWRWTLAGDVADWTLPRFHLAIRRCSWRMRPDGDWDAEWEEDVTYWIDRWDECKAQAFEYFVRRLEEFAARPAPGNLDLEALVAITGDATEFVLPPPVFYSLRNNLSSAIHRVQATQLRADANATNAPSACSEYACAFLTGTDDVLLFPRYDSTPRLVDASDVGVAEETTSFSLHLPAAMMSDGGLAVSTVRERLGRGVQDSVFQPIPGINYFGDTAVLLHVTSSRTFSEWQADGRLPATFLVNNTGAVDLFNCHVAVWSLGDDEASTTLCPWVDGVQGSLDTYWCNKFVRGPRDFTTAVFLVSSGCHQSSDYFFQVFEGYNSIPIHEPALRKVADLANHVVVKSIDTHIEKADKIPGTWHQILSHVVLDEAAFTASTDRVQLLVSNLTARHPVVGFSLARLVDPGAVRTIAGGERNFSSESAVDLVLSTHLEQRCAQLAVMAVTNFSSKLYSDGSLGAYIKRRLMVVHLVVTSKSNPHKSTDEDYFDIQLRADKVHRHESENVVDVNQVRANTNDSGPNFRFLVATWSDATGDWSVSSCARRRSTRAMKQVFCCTLPSSGDAELHGRFLIFEPIRFTDAVAGPLLAILIAAGTLSAVSLASLAATALVVAPWRHDLGHRVLLQMTLALACNLAAAFTSSLVSVDTTSVACVAIGVLRHWFYLAMFAWMLVMSGLQLRRLLSLRGSKDTKHLLFKVSALAWGVPAAVVTALVTFKKDMFLSDVADRGFCYPEGDAFTWTVQAPAAAILVLNAVVFVVITARVYNFCGWGVAAGLSRHMDERTFQMRRLRAVFFTFCLFGLTWVFHLLAEQGVFLVKYLYEYLFLMTASVHLFSLSFIFVFSDRETRAEWVKFIARARTELDSRSKFSSSSCS